MTAKRFKKNSLIITAKVVVAITILWFLINTAQIKMELFATMFHRPFLFASVIFLFLFMVVIGAWRWFKLNKAQAINMSFRNTLLPTYLGIAFNNLLPGAIGGDFVRMHYLFKKIPQKKSTAAISIVLDRIFGFMGIFVILSFAALFQIHFLNQQSWFSTILLIGITTSVAAILLVIAMISWSQKIGLTQRLEQRYADKKWIKPIISFLNAAYVYRIPKLVLVECLCISVVIHFLIALSTLIIAEIMGLPSISFSHYMIAISLTQIVNLIPVTPGGIGVGEFAFANVLALLNPGTSAAFATVFLAYRLISILTYLPGAVLYIPRILFLKQANRV